ncbi:MAG: protein phosphatase 2C domain-containing protein [Proteobacteria bacterium]|nr:protein phosphatase 2C domain-containing protein [Pseudomonadota bacterium]
MRAINQDCFGEFHHPSRALHLLVVADGLGGHRGGEHASRLAVDTIGRIFETAEDEGAALLERALKAANAAIHAAADTDVALAGMGTTAVVLLLDGEGRGLVAHVGDSRAYRVRDGAAVQLTQDHSLVGEQLRRGQLSPEEAEHHPQRHELLRALGPREDVEVEVTAVGTRGGDRFVLCSDGLTGVVTDAEIAAIVVRERPEDAVGLLVDTANARGGPDNVTVQIAVLPADLDTQTWPEHPAAPGPAESGTWATALIVGLLVVALLFLAFGP